jgi:HK97 family phage prohead protease
MEHKSIQFEIKDISLEKRTAIVAHAVYGNIDLTGDISTKGMFSSSWERKDAIGFYFNHDESQIPGVVVRTYEDEKKAYTEVKFGNWKLGDDMLAMIESGVIRGASFGYETEKKDFIMSGKRKVRVLKQVKHFETSLLTKIPANPLAGVIAYTKSAENDTVIAEWKSHIEKMDAFCRNANASDDCIINIQAELKAAQLIISNYDTSPTPLIPDGGASRNDNDSFRNRLLLLNLQLPHMAGA